MAKNKNQKNLKQAQPAVLPADPLLEFYDSAIFWLIAAVIFIIPLFFEIHSYDQFEMPKLTLLRIFTIAILLMWAGKIIHTGRINYSPTPLDVPLVLWSAMNIICTFASVSPYLSFRGKYENFAGSLSNLNYVVLYFAVSQNIKDKKQIYGVNIALLFSCFLLTIYSLMQYFGMDFIKWNAASVIQGRYFASMGNPNFLGAIMIMMVPAEIAFFVISWKNKKPLYSLLIFILFIMTYMALFGTQSRGPFLGFVFSFLFLMGYGIYAAYKELKKESFEAHATARSILSALGVKYRAWLVGFVILILLAGTLSLTFGRDATKRIFDSISNIKGSLQLSRLHIWEPALKIIEAKPLLGTGVDSFKTVFPQYEGVNFAQIDGANVSSRTAHNELLNIAATMGLTSLGIYLLAI